MMCTHAYTKNHGAKNFDIAVLEDFFPTCRLIVINGIGEPFLHPDIKDILETFRKYQIKVSTTTNLSYLPEDPLPHIPGVFYRLSISCDGAPPEIFEGIRRHGKFSLFLQNVKRVRKICGDTILHMAVTSMRQNILEAPELVKLASSLGFDEVRFGRLETNPFLKNETDFLFHYPNIASELLQKSVAKGNDCGIKVMILVVFQGTYDEEKAKKERERLPVSNFFHNDLYYKALHRQYMCPENERIFEQQSYEPTGVVHCSGICHWLAFGNNFNINGQLILITDKTL